MLVVVLWSVVLVFHHQPSLAKNVLGVGHCWLLSLTVDSSWCSFSELARQHLAVLSVAVCLVAPCCRYATLQGGSFSNMSDSLKSVVTLSLYVGYLEHNDLARRATIQDV